MAVAVSPRTRVTLIKSFTYRGQPEEFSNTYHLDGVAPTTTAGWDALVRGIWQSEGLCCSVHTHLVRAYGYLGGQKASVVTIDYTVTDPPGLIGTYPDQQGNALPGDAAVTARGAVGRSSKGKQVYVRFYLHGGQSAVGNADAVEAGLLGRIQDHAAAMVAGTNTGGLHWCSPSGTVATNPHASPFVTTRTLERRGKRPIRAG